MSAISNKMLPFDGVTMTAPLLEENSFLKTPFGSVLKDIFAFRPISDTHRCMRINQVAKTIFFLVAAVAARSIYYDLPLQLLPNNPALGHTLAVASVVSWTGLLFKSFSNFDQSRLVLLKLAEPGKPYMSNSPFIEIAKIIVSLVGGFLAAVPIFTVAYIDNHNSLLYLTFSIPNAILATLSCYKSINALERRFQLTQADKEIVKEQKIFLQRFSCFINTLPELDDVEPLTALCEGAKTATEEEEKVLSLKKLLVQTTAISERKKSTKVEQIVYGIFVGIGSLFALCQLIWIGILSHRGWSIITSNTGTVITLSILAVLINSYYSQELMINVVTSILPTVQHAARCQRKPTLAEKHYPLMTYALKATVIASSLLAFGPPVLITSAAPYPWNYISAVFYSGLGMLAPITPVTGSVDNLVSEMALKAKDEKIRRIFDLHVKLSSLRFTLEHTSTHAYKTFKAFLMGQERNTADVA